MATKLFVNLPVQDLDRSVKFFTKLGYAFDPQFTDEKGTCLIIDKNISVMLLVKPFFKTFAPGKKVADATKTTEAILAITEKSRHAVKKIVERAFKAGARRYKEPSDHGFMYEWGFEDLDGHIWEHLWMDPKSFDK